MRIEDRLDRDTRDKLNRLRGTEKKSRECRKPKKKCQEKLSDRDIENLMGIHRPRYYRDRGSFKQR